MNKLCELKIQDGSDRSQMCSILAEHGYAVSVEEREPANPRHYNAKDYYIIVYEKAGERKWLID